MFGLFSKGISAAFDVLVTDEIEDRVEAMTHHHGAHGYDSWGGSREAARRMLGLVGWFYRHYFRVEASGLQNVPDTRVLLVGNHSTQFAIDAMLIGAAMALDREPPRHVHAMIEKSTATAPFVNILMMRVGQQIGLPLHAERLLTRDESAVLVFPEGERGGGKTLRDYYKLLKFGTGFMRVAMKTKTPIVPFGFVGGEEMCSSVSRMEPLAKMIGAAYIPLTPTIVPVVFPAKCHLLFGKPMYFDGVGNEEDRVIHENVEEVRDAIAGLIQEGRDQRRSVFW